MADDPNNPATPPNPPTPAPVGAAPPASGETPSGNSPPESGTPPAKPEPTWEQERLRVQTARFHQEKQRADALEAEIAQLRAGSAPRPQGTPSQAEINSAIDNAANIRATQMKFNDDCNRIVEEGRKEFGAEEFDASVGQLARLITPGDDQSTNAYMTMITAAIRSGKGAEVVNKLGKDLRTAQRIMGMDAMGMAAEVTKIASGVIKTEVSGAPKPITPVASRASGLQDIDPADPERQSNLTTQEWMKRRNEQVSKQGSGRSSRFR